FQSRPNVLFEAGLAMGSHADRTILVQIGQHRPFSDIGGRHIIHFRGTHQERNDLASRLENAGCSVDKVGGDWLNAGDFSAALAATRNSDPEAPPRNTAVAPTVYPEDLRKTSKDELRDQI